VRPTTGRLTRWIWSNGLDYQVETEKGAKSRTQRCDIAGRWPKVIENRHPAIQKRFDIDDLPRPLEFLDGLPTKAELPALPVSSHTSTVQVFRVRRPQHPGQVARARMRRLLAVVAIEAFVPCASSRNRSDHRNQHFPELHTALRLDHNNLTALEWRGGVESCRKTPHVAHRAITHQVDPLDHSLSLGTA
jgi:hypothetical protein